MRPSRAVGLSAILALGAACACAGVSGSGPGSAVGGATSGPVGAVSARSATVGFGLHPADGPALRAAITAPGAAATVVNVWATWCEPCVRELPDIVRASRDLRPRRVRTLLVSVDFESERDSARALLERLGVDFPTYVKVGDDQSFIDTLSKGWSGSIPVTFVFDAEGRVRFFREGDIDHDALLAAVDAVVD